MKDFLIRILRFLDVSFSVFVCVFLFYFVLFAGMLNKKHNVDSILNDTIKNNLEKFLISNK